MSQISRLKDAEITNGNLINADDIDVEFNQLVNESNSQDTRLGVIESGNITLDGVKTFLKAPKVDKIDARTPGAGLTLESVVLQAGTIEITARIAIASVNTTTNELITSLPHGLSTGTAIQFVTDHTLPSPLSSGTTYYARLLSSTTITVHHTLSDAQNGVNALDITTVGTGAHAVLSDPPTQTNGQLWYNKAESKFKARRNGVTRSILLSGDSAGTPKGAIRGPVPEWVSATSVKIPAGFLCRDVDDSLDMGFEADTVVSITASGVNGLDSGSEAQDTWYYVWAIDDSTGVNSAAGLLSASNSSPTLPTGYDKKRLLPLAIRNDSSSHFLRFVIGEGWPQRPVIYYDTGETFYNGASFTMGPTNILNAGVATSWTIVSAASFIPPIARFGVFHCLNQTTSAINGYFSLRSGGATSNGLGLHLADPTDQVRSLATNSSQQVEYKRNSGSATLSLDVAGFIVTEVF